MATRIHATPVLSYSALLPFFSRRAARPTTFRPSPSPCRFVSVSVSSMARRGISTSPSSSQEDQFASPEELRFEPPLRIVEYPDPILRAKNKRINTFDERLKKLVVEMFDVMYKTDGVGLSAPQVGVNVQLMVFNPAGERGEGEEIVLVNPIVYKASQKTILFNEGCLSFPGIYADVERPASVKIDARDITGRRFKVNLSGLPARVFQHEFDHLQGTLFFDRMTQDVLESIRSELKALEKKYEEKTGKPSPEKIDDYEGIKVVAGFAGR